MKREMLLMKVSALANGSIAPQSVMQAIDVYVEAVLAAFVAGEPSPDARYRAEPLLGNRWAVTTHGVMLDICVSAEQARAVANVLNYLEAARG